MIDPGEIWIVMLFVVGAGYLLGSIPFGLLLTRGAGLGDIRSIGSGNIGATNVLRTGRRGLAAGTLILDALKGAAAVLIGATLLGPSGALVGGVASVLGHLYPVWLRFRGGKGVATGFGVLIAATPLAGLLAGAVWLGMAATLRYSSAAALASFALAPVICAIVRAPVQIILLAAILGVLIWFRHGANISRLLSGAEPKIGQK
jgi:glycerol-3-phosphate acyltransferase PlsY